MEWGGVGWGLVGGVGRGRWEKEKKTKKKGKKKKKRYCSDYPARLVASWYQEAVFFADLRLVSRVWCVQACSLVQAS